MNYKELNEIMRKIRQAEEEFNKKLAEALNPVINVILYCHEKFRDVMINFLLTKEEGERWRKLNGST